MVKIATAGNTSVAVMMTVLSYVMFVMSVVMISKKKEVYGGAAGIYVDVAIATLVAGCLQMVFMVVYWFGSKKRLFSVLNVIVVTVFFALFTFGAAVAMAVKRHDYCRPPKNGLPPHSGKLTGIGSPHDCQGVMRGLLGMTWARFGWDLVFIGFLLGLVWENGHDGVDLTTPVGQIPLPPAVNEKDEEAAAHH